MVQSKNPSIDNTNGKTYISGIDLLRFIASVGVIFSHSFMEYQNFFDNYIVRICVRWIVPFFLIVTGYFLKEDLKAFIRFMLHILIQYIFWTVFYALVFQYDIWSVRRFLSALRSGIVLHLWYYPTLMICAVFVWLLIRLIKDPKWILLICFVLYIIAFIGHTLINVPAFDVINNSWILRLHHRIMGEVTTRDGVFWGSLYIAIGYTLKKHRNSERMKIQSYTKFWLLFIPVFILASLEEWAVVWFNTGEKDILFGTIPMAILLFVLGLNLKLEKKTGEFLRSTGNTVYVIHYLFLEILIRQHFLSWKLFLLTTLFTVGSSVLLTLLSSRWPKLKYIL